MLFCYKVVARLFPTTTASLNPNPADFSVRLEAKILDYLYVLKVSGPASNLRVRTPVPDKSLNSNR
jgi:hypothetical protein